MNIFSYLDYRKYLQALIAQNREKRGYQSRLSVAMECSKSLLSQVLKGDLHLTQEHVCRLAHTLGLNEDERGYFLLMISFARAGTKELQDHYQAQLQNIRQQQRELSERLKKTSTAIDDQYLLTYASHWIYPAIHVVVNIKAYRQAETMAKLFKQPISKINQALSDLRQMGLLKKVGPEWVSTERDFHIPRSSKIAPLIHSNWRHKTMTQLMEAPEIGTHYSGVHSLDPKTYLKLKEELVELLTRSRQDLESARNKNLVYFGLDLFEL